MELGVKFLKIILVLLDQFEDFVSLLRKTSDNRKYSDYRYLPQLHRNASEFRGDRWRRQHCRWIVDIKPLVRQFHHHRGPWWMTNWMLNRISWSYLINWKPCFDDKLWKLRTNEQRMCISDDFWQFYLNYGRFSRLCRSFWPIQQIYPFVAAAAAAAAVDDSNCTPRSSVHLASTTRREVDVVDSARSSIGQWWHCKLISKLAASAPSFNL